MYKRLLAGFLFLGFLAACDKDKFQTKPQITIASVSTDVVPVNGNIRFIIEYTDKEGDVSDSLFVKKVRINQRVVATNLDSFWTTIPDFPKSQRGEFLVDMNYQTILSALSPPPGPTPGSKEPDSLILKFLARDDAGNKSDTITSSLVIVQR